MDANAEQPTATPGTHRLADLRPPAELRGAPQAPAWRNPTVWLWATTLLLFGFCAVAATAWRWPVWVTIPVSALAIYLGFTVLHESVHRVAHPDRRVNDALGWLPGLLLTVTQPMFRAVHTKHHTNTNDPSVDPDLAVANSPRWLRPLWLISPLWEYRLRYYRHHWARTRAERNRQIALDAVIVALIAASWPLGFGPELLIVWIVPLLAALMFLALSFDYAPHTPFDSTERGYDTRSYPSRTLNVVLLGQNYHLVHHLWNSVPWYRYQRVHHLLGADLESLGARVHWGDERRPLATGRRSGPVTSP